MAGSHSPSPVFSLSLPPFLLLLYLFFPPHVSLITIRRSTMNAYPFLCKSSDLPSQPSHLRFLVAFRIIERF
ncbi:hypothetical protein V6N12_038258 [Hibiscus sabdariffa]|uniref:Secreted protein n=1 Tax=Hibiscus sabdariffa TaxID=183260 RepID=A0ABR2BYM5_9ROSI